MNPVAPPKNGGRPVPKIIWILWLQGIQNAPPLVQQCVASWRKYNPDWKVIVLDEHNLAQHAVISLVVLQNAAKVSPQAVSDVLRINLLAQHGGVWADATCLCCRPLDEWLHDCTRSGFFAFAKPAKDRLLASWFLAASKDCPLTRAYSQMVNDYFILNSRPLKWRFARSIAKSLEKISMCSPQLASYLVHPCVVQFLPVNPYFSFHYNFYRVVATNERCRQIWDATPKISAAGPHEMQRKAFQLVTPEIKSIITARPHPVCKLNWRLSAAPPGSVLDYLLRTV